ncbi:hypothetical protein [Nocardia seriolae]|uniref:Chaplin domain-containing protein n=1 Tax=Nocardia seriolae TaxID=37332 RepID=A0A0B8N589_9NOCA|nr:hypothetical protein [Nocardia seriolae]APA94221.1 hypothetical protein NS506_00134 [Nocardia seriolae]MTJ60552.1 hypothetical protein [Nocardia seriolae]MTJ72217.1 hypothetical protein [Nocardia seriolae]MTJ84564.1 hypothetical protein [Nocardia seriolae]MTK28552.1 hypothetical protein [Nocardia seriolae]
MKRTAIGLLAMTTIALGAGLSPAAASAPEQDSVAAAVADNPGVGSSGSSGSDAVRFVPILINTIVKCLTAGSGGIVSPGSTQTGCLN